MSAKLIIGRAAATTVLALFASAIAATAAPAAAPQKGVLGTGASPTTGVWNPLDGGRFTAFAAGAGTAVVKLSDGGRLERYRYFPRNLVVPAVAQDGSAGGLSADGETLVLAEPGTRFPQTRSEFTVLDTERLRVRDTLSFDGTFTYDAISPDGRSLYLIEYTSPRDLTQYLVREYDLVRGRFNPDPIIDPNESSEDMYGSPVTRMNSPDGRWAYTLYETAEGGHPPFIHALDTERGTAVCIDLDPLAGERDVFRLGLAPSPDGATLDVVDVGDPVASVDLATFEVSESAAPAAATPSADDGSDLMPWIAIAGGGALLACALLLLRGRRHRGGDSADEREQVDQLERLVAAENGTGEREREHDPVR